MGTKCAPAWAQLVLRMYELKNPLPNSLLLMCYIDDGLTFHPITMTLSGFKGGAKTMITPTLTMEQMNHEMGRN